MRTIKSTALLLILVVYLVSCQELTDKLNNKKSTQNTENALEDDEPQEDDEEWQDEKDTTQSSENQEELSFHEELYGKNTESKNYDKLVIDDYNNQIAKFIAGLESQKYSDLQTKPFYQSHKSNIQQAWARTESEDLEPITRWTRENIIAGNPQYTATVFYPFSGPDILYANAFFPFAQNYVLVGLEKIGSLPHIESLSQDAVNEYLTGIRASQRYLNKHGYYMTTHMQKDFAQSELNGTIHLILYYLALTKHEILGVEEIAVNNYGTVTEKQLGNIRGIRVDFSTENLKNKQSVYYFKLDLSNENMVNNEGFSRFLSNQFDLHTYMKSASYILHDSHFSTICDFILTKSIKILQDDTGVPYYKFKKTPFELTLFGKYTSTIKDFKNHYQPELKKALDLQENKHELPFIVGYSSWLGETLLMYATKNKEEAKLLAEKEKTKKKETIVSANEKNVVKNEVNSEKTPARKLVYKVQFLFSAKYFKEGSTEFKGLKNVGYYQENGAYKYTIGNEISAQDCILLKKKAVEAGFEDAFIVAFFDGKRISLHTAKKISN
jgi:hypothetical protein